MIQKLRQVMMFMPGNKPNMLNNANINRVDTLIFDLEDAIAVTEKDSARIHVANALRTLKFVPEVAVRINHISTPYGWDDLATVLPAKPNLIRLPKAETAEEIKEISAYIDKVEKECGFANGTIKMMGAIETPLGLSNAYEMCIASPRMVAMALGGEDFIANLKTQRTAHGMELFVARSQIVFAARRAGIQAIDTVFANINDMEGFRREVEFIRDLGFDGKSIIHPSQIPVVREVFTPNADLVAKSARILLAYKEALDNNLGVFVVDGRMVDGPIIDRARRVIEQAQIAGMQVPQEVIGL